MKSKLLFITLLCVALAISAAPIRAEASEMDHQHDHRAHRAFGNAIKPYYGEAAGNKWAELLREHILIAGKIVDAAKSGNRAEVEKFNKEWYKNAEDIAMFLSGANPNWTAKQLKELLDVHLQLVADNVAARLRKDWKADITAFDKGEEHLIMLADVLAEGIIKQFPQQFN